MLKTIREFYFPPISDDERRTIRKMLDLLLVLAASVAGIHWLIVLLFSASYQQQQGINIAIIALSLSVRFLARRWSVRGSSLLFLLLLWSIISYALYLSNGMQSTGREGLLIVIVVAALLLGVRYAFLFSVLGVITFTTLLILGLRDQMPASIPNDPYYAWGTFIIFIVLTWVLLGITVREMRYAMRSSFFQVQERQKAENELRDQAQYLSALHETALAIINRLELEPLLESILNRGEIIAQTNHGYIDMYIPEKGELVQVIGHGVFEKYNGQVNPGGEGMSHYIRETRQPIVVNDYNRWEFASRHYANQGFHAVAGIPLLSKDRFVGVMGVAKTGPGESFNEQEFERLKQFGELASLALYNSELYQAAQDELKQRMLTEQALRESETNLQLAVQAGSTVTWAWHTASNKMSWSKDAHTILNIDAARLGESFTTFAEVIHPQDQPGVIRKIQRTLEKKKHDLSLKFRTRDRDNKNHWVEVSGQLLFDEQGNVTNVTGTAKDITAQVAAQNKIKQANKNLKRYTEMLERRTNQFQLAADVARAASEYLDPDALSSKMVDLVALRFNLYYVGLFMTDETGEWAELTAATGEEGRLLIANQHRLDVFGNSSMVGWAIANRQPRIALDIGEEAVRFNNPVLPETRSELALPLITRGNVIGALSIQSSREADFSKEDIVAFQTMADQLANAIMNARLYNRLQEELNERRMVEAQIRQLNLELEERVRMRTADLQATEEKFRALAENNPLQITRYGQDTRYVYVNRIGTGENIHPQEVIGKTIREVIGDLPVVDFAEECIRKVFETGEVLRTEYELGNYVAAWWLAPEFDTQGNVVSVIATTLDITERKKMEQELRQRTQELQATNRELEAFSYSVSHDLRAPLRAIDGFSRILEEDFTGQLSQDGLGFLQRIRQSTRHMSNLIEDLLRLSRITRAELRMTPLNLSELAAEVTGQLVSENEGRETKVVIDPDMEAVGDERLIRVALENLVNNALKFSAQNPKPAIHIGRVGENLQATFFVRDNGVGFDMTYANKLFGAFQRLHSDEFPGSGIGLAIVQRIIHRHGGHIWADSQPEQGATFYFTLNE